MEEDYVRKQLVALGVLCALLPGFGGMVQAVDCPSVSAASAVLMDADSGRVLYEKDGDTPRAIASITKLMTALVAVECLDDLSQSVTIRPEWTGVEGTSLYLKAGEEIALETLLYGLLLHSGNDAAVALSAICGGKTETFVEWMNQRAKDLGMVNTHFADPHGLSSENHYSTARDMAKLAAACLKNPTISKVTATRTIVLQGRSFTNHNKLLWQYENCTGMKTGYTRQAGRTLVSSAEKDGQRLVCVTLNDSDDWRDHKALLDYGFSAFPQTTLAQAGEVLGQVPMEGSLLHQLPAAVRDTVRCPLQKGEEVTTQVDLPDQVQAPVFAGKIAGSVRFFVGSRQVGESYLIWQGSAGRDVLKKPPARSPLEWLKRWKETAQWQFPSLAP